MGGTESQGLGRTDEIGVSVDILYTCVVEGPVCRFFDKGRKKTSTVLEPSQIWIK